MVGLGETLQEKPDQRSIREIIEQCYRAKLPEYFAAFKEYARALEASTPTVSEFMKRFPVIEQVSQLETWVNPENNTRAARSRRHTILRAGMLEAIGQDGEASEEADQMLSAAFSKPGAPVKPMVRRVAIAALEAKRTDAKFSWQRFANAHCPCSKTEHNRDCKERIRQASMELQRLLRKLGIVGI
jgi:hypothetical protein